jgi:hypothetical protein
MKNHTIANNSGTTETIEKINAYLKSLEFWPLMAETGS